MEKELYHGLGCNQYQHRCNGAHGPRIGKRRYLNKDGSLSGAGKNRLERDIRENNAKKKDNRIIIDTENPETNADRWVREDLERRKRVVDSTSSITRDLKSIERETSPRPVKNRMDLSKMTDRELRERIDRERLERQYNELFNEPAKIQVSKGRKFARDTLEIGGSVLAIGSSALGIALAIKELRG